MTPELQKEVIVACVSVFSSALFAGIPAVFLFWWTYRRDQERIKVQKYVSYADSLQGKEAVIKNEAGAPVLGILIRNQSLFPVYVNAVGFNIDGEVIQLERVYYPLKLKRNPDQDSNRPNIPDDSVANQVDSGTYIIIKYYGLSSRDLVNSALLSASTKHNISIEDLVLSNKVTALVALESGKQFSSLSPSMRLWRFVIERFITLSGQPWNHWKRLIARKR